VGDSRNEGSMSLTLVGGTFAKHLFDNQMTSPSHPKPRSASPILYGNGGNKNVDAIMRGVQSPSEETQIERFPPLSVRVGVAWLVGFLARLYLGKRTEDLKDAAVPKVIEFYIATKFSRRVKWLPPQERGRVIAFCPPTKKSA
jgi:hypothetical protein